MNVVIQKEERDVPHYQNAPITEAVIDFRVRVPSTVSADTLKDLQGAQEPQFPRRQELKRAVVQIQLGEEQVQTPTAAGVTFGWAFWSEDGKRVVQSRLDGFTFSRLAPYDRWESLQEEARQFWGAYRNLAQPEAITQIGIKYVNRFDIPLPLRDFKDFFRTTPEVSPAMPQGLAGFFMQLQIPYPDSQAMAVITQTLVPPPRAGLVSVVLDIDLSRASNLPGEDPAIWELLNQLRSVKNSIFEGCITDAARELIR